MGSHDLYKRRKAERRERKTETREPKPNSFLIITEGNETEPNYFDGLAKHINKRFERNIDVQRPQIDTHGEGKSTESLVQKALRIAARSKIIYYQTWILFDKDDFNDFDDAIQLCKSQNCYAGWSNPSFEYWLNLHFSYSKAAIHRKDWSQKLDDIFKTQLHIKSGYNKNDADLFERITANGGLKNAVRNAEKIDKEYDDKTQPSRCNPCTKVNKLIQELEPWLPDLLQEDS